MILKFYPSNQKIICTNFFLLFVATWFDCVKNQGFIPNACFESESEEETDDYETDTEYETDNDDANNQYQTFKRHNQSNDCNINSNIDNDYTTETFVVEDPFVEVKDEQIECTDDSSTIHLKNGFTLCGKFRKKRRCGFGGLTGPSLERKGTKFCIKS